MDISWRMAVILPPIHVTAAVAYELAAAVETSLIGWGG